MFVSRLRCGATRATSRFSRLSRNCSSGASSSSTAAAAESAASSTAEAAVPPTNLQLFQQARLAAIPMLGFGFMDNIIMIQAGDYIDTTFGAVLGISTLTAAGFGNVCSDVSGVLFGGVVESAADKLNLARPQWSAAQRELRAVRLASTAGAAVGIVCGCLLGMCTLLLKDLDAAERLKKAKALETVFATVMQNGHQLIGAERCTLYLYDEASHELWTKVSTGADVVVALPLGRQAIACAAARERKLVNVADAYADSRFDRSIDGQTGFVTRQVLAVPIVDDDERLVGCIQAINKSGSREPFTPADEKLVTMLATHIQLFTQELGV